MFKISHHKLVCAGGNETTQFVEWFQGWKVITNDKTPKRENSLNKFANLFNRSGDMGSLIITNVKRCVLENTQIICLYRQKNKKGEIKNDKNEIKKDD